MNQTHPPVDQRATGQRVAEESTTGAPAHLAPPPIMAAAVDVGWLVGIHAVIMTVMMLLRGIDQGDVRFWTAFTIFLMPGWWLAPRFCRFGSGLETRYAVTAILAFVIHVWLVWPGSRWGLGFDHYYVAFSGIALTALIIRVGDLRRNGLPRYRMRVGQLVASGALVLLICAAWRVPHSNDVEQFLLQQIDMAEQRSLAPSAIGMTALGVDQTMPRWNANVYHVWFSLMGDVTRLPVEGVVRRWATVAMAVVSLLMLCVCVTRYSGRRIAAWVVVLSVIGPVTLWFRSYNAYVYGMRVTNNFCLDKDFALFWLVPAWLWVFHSCLRIGDKKSWLLLFALSPLCLLIHPMTPVYLCGLFPFAVIIAAPGNRRGVARGLIGGGLALLMFGFLFAFGGAQAYHQEIEAIVHRDASIALETGRPLHYWEGHYATVPRTDVQLDTTEWSDGRFRLRPVLLWTCSALLMLPIACVIWGLVLWARRKQPSARDWRSWAGVTISLCILWVLFAGSSFFLTERPHLYRGFERLHWFAFLPSLVAIAGCVSAISDVIGRRTSVRWFSFIALTLLVVHLGEQAWHISRSQPTWLKPVRVFHSVFDIYVEDEPEKTRRVLSRFSVDEGPVPPVPDYLRETDRVLILRWTGRTPFWEMRQAIWWPELYGEGYALAVFGDPFWKQWQAYYASVDGSDDPAADQWIAERGVTLLLDDRPAAEEYVTPLAKRLGRSATEVSSGVWRLGE